MGDTRMHLNLSPPQLVEAALARGTGHLTRSGALVTVTSPHTGRSPKDRYIVRGRLTEDAVDWSATNMALPVEPYHVLRDDFFAFLRGRELFVRDARAGGAGDHGVDLRLVTTSPWHDLFAHNMFLAPEKGVSDDGGAGAPELRIFHAPEMTADPTRHGTRSGTFVILDLDERIVLIGGTLYAGEIKKSVFSVLNFLLPERNVLPMHCSASVGRKGDVALFFGLSGTGKTTLSADPGRGLIGDDEHGWNDEGVFNFEGGCYAKAIRLSSEREPEIHAATGRFGTILENVVLDPETREVDFDDDAITENTRASYPVEFIPGAVMPGRGGHPRNIFFLTCDAFGVLPPIARLSPSEAMAHFLSGYTAKVAGTEEGVTEPTAVFSACFGAPFLPRPAEVYGRMLRDRIAEHDCRVWLVSTGWTGGGYGVGERIDLEHTRAVVRAALEGALDDAPFAPEPAFGLQVPTSVPGVPTEILVPRRTWGDPAAYDAAAQRLGRMFEEQGHFDGSERR